MSDIKELLLSIGENFKATARTETIYGEPQTLYGRTIIPVGKVSYGMGGGGGEARGEEGKEGKGAGLGGGGGVTVQPLGFLEVTEEGTRFIPVEERRKIVQAAVMGFFLGVMLARRLTKK